MSGLSSRGFIRVPKTLLMDDRYCDLSPAAVLLYSLLLDRLSLSTKNGKAWEDPAGSVFVYFTLRNVQNTFHIGHDMATKLFSDLENVKLITRKKQGRGKPARIYVHPVADCRATLPMTAEYPHHSMRQCEITDCGKAASNKTNNSNIESNYTDQTEATYMQHWLDYELPVDDANT